MSYYVDGFGEFISLVCRSISVICPQPEYLMRFWQIKHAEDPGLALAGLELEGRDTYERTDNYNIYGLFCFFAIHTRQAFFDWVGQPVSTEE